MPHLGINEITFLAQGLKWTLFLTAIGFAGGIVFGLVIALGRVAENRALRMAAAGWIAVFQGTPLLMQLFVVFFGLPLLGVNVSAWLAVAIALTAHASAFLGEIWRGAIQAIPKGQSEASHALGLHYRSRMFDIILPQALKISLPATVGFLVQLLKGTSLAAIVGFIELTRAGQIVSNQTYQPLFVFGLVGVLYFLMCWPLSHWGRRMEARLAQDPR
ncbi:amino acid ABC transporter membrane protein 2, PAAT family (TC 3.A.1.3.-) [Paracoccus aminovorans]|uniref:Amino acid ABC transporter membrane protein 2, PAAT family (TC 3.A.1.3.-) n=1 Tax=Paracoccus aminovorans TaxID=34004 RepID=A0A1I3BTL1_9RHOB|nr:amino acid ABC transporter permease [Paracoccus aminovorans]CQR86217.1 amino acid ABC transporter, permease [Paracoccus aminovorans]SFH65091.1 amino acid ABC transporter membrane protein 2, PAAT family (TC 3.A.1.3.-) [Paracoccus aminovorans]